MAVLDIQFRLTLNNIAVPLTKQSMHVIDPYNLSEALDIDVEEQVEMSLVSFKATADMIWLEKALKLPMRWWLRHHGLIPLILEIRELIKNKKVKQGSGVRLPREQESLVVLKVRERILFVQNLPNMVILGLSGTPGVPQGSQQDEIGTLQWFLEELQKDIETLQGQEQAEQPKKRGSVPQEDKEIVEECIERLQSHPQCLRVCYMPSRHSFRVVRQDKSSSEFLVTGLKRKRQGTEMEEVDNQFNKAVSAALVFLDPSHADPLPDVPPAGLQEESQPSS